MKHNKSTPVADPGLSRPGTPAPEFGAKLIIWQDFCQKLHEIERNWTERISASARASVIYCLIMLWYWSRWNWIFWITVFKQLYFSCVKPAGKYVESIKMFTSPGFPSHLSRKCSTEASILEKSLPRKDTIHMEGNLFTVMQSPSARRSLSSRSQDSRYSLCRWSRLTMDMSRAFLTVPVKDSPSMFRICRGNENRVLNRGRKSVEGGKEYERWIIFRLVSSERLEEKMSLCSGVNFVFLISSCFRCFILPKMMNSSSGMLLHMEMESFWRVTHDLMKATTFCKDTV